jgi:hypothetical protein
MSHVEVAEMVADDLVEYVGPQRDVVSWPSHGETGVVQRMDRGGVRILWQRSTLMMAWPRDWIRKTA